MGALSVHAGEEPANLGGGLVNNSALPAAVCFAFLLPSGLALFLLAASCSPCITVPPARPGTCREPRRRVPSPSVSSLHVARASDVDAFYARAADARPGNQSAPVALPFGRVSEERREARRVVFWGGSSFQRRSWDRYTLSERVRLQPHPLSPLFHLPRMQQGLLRVALHFCAQFPVLK
ncbi:hypothetical protein MTO96_014523 [Rhipicephalus appendiculatus]